MWNCPKCNEGLQDEFEVCWSCGTTKDGTLDPHFLDPEAVTTAPENEPLDAIVGAVDEEPEQMVTVAQCNLTAEAHAMRLHLEAEGIPVFLADELTVAMDWLLSNAIGGVKVQVPEHYAEQATEVLKAFARPSQQDSDYGDDDSEEVQRQE